MQRHVPHIVPDLGSTLAPDAPTQDQVLSPTAPKRAHNLCPSWSQLAQVGRRLARVQPNLWPRTGKFDPSRLFVGSSRPASFLSVLFPACRQCWSRSNLYIGAQQCADIRQTVACTCLQYHQERCSEPIHQTPAISVRDIGMHIYSMVRAHIVWISQRLSPLHSGCAVYVLKQRQGTCI